MALHGTLLEKLIHLRERFEEVGHLLSDPAVIQDQERFRQLSREFSRLEPLAADIGRYRQLRDDLATADKLCEYSDPVLAALARVVVVELRRQLGDLEPGLKRHLLPKDERDEGNVFLEIRAGTGGDEAALFAGDLFRMYSRYAEERGWRVELLSATPGEQGGYREVISRVAGEGVFSRLKFESGAHRVQRVPATESQGRIHTSACTVAILPEMAALEEVVVNDKDLRVDTFRSAGAGGQHVNKTDSAVRLTHLPSGIVVECQQERSQHKNRARAMALLKARLEAAETERRDRERAQERKSLVGTGDRSERIRTYNYPERRVTDHRINLTLHKLDAILEGDLDPIVDALVSEHQAEQLAGLGASSAEA